MKKNKYLPYVLFGLPLLVGVYFVLKNLKIKKRNVDSSEPQNPVKDAVNTVKDTISGYTPTSGLPFKKGMQSTYIESIQQKLGGLKIDGKFGSKTEAKVKAFQKANNLTDDGIVGKNTWRALFGTDFPQTFSQSSSSGGYKTPTSEKTNYSIRPKFSTTQSNDWN